jgi:hypothetical protein
MRKFISGLVLLGVMTGVLVSDSYACGRRRHGWFHQSNRCPASCLVPANQVETPAAQPELPPLKTRTGKTYQVTATNDRGNFEHDLPEAAVGVAPVKNDGIHFVGKSRKIAKTSIAHASVEDFDTLNALLDPLLSKNQFSDKTMRGEIAPDSQRIDEEKRNVSVKAFLYATKKETDNDYHLLLGPDPSDGDDMHYMTAEVSGLPNPDNTATEVLKAARAQFENFILDSGGQLPGTNYLRFHPPIPVIVSGSLFFDIDHKPGDVGTGTVVPESVWEIHPITKIVFEP